MVTFRIMLSCNYAKFSYLSLNVTTNKDEKRQNMNLNVDSFLAFTKVLLVSHSSFIPNYGKY